MVYKIHNKNKNFFGFTLIELLVVVAVISMLMSFAAVSFNEARKKARDSKREEDIKTLQNSLGLYATNNGFFPVCAQTVIDGTSDCFSSSLISDGSANALPRDPLGGSTGTCGALDNYVYCYTCLDGFSYTLEYALETDGIPSKSVGWQTVTIQH